MAVNLLGHLLNLISQRIRNLCRTNLTTVAIVLRLIIKELILSQNLDHRQSDIFLTIIIYGTSKFPSDNRSLCDKHITLRKRTLHSLIEVLNALHLADSEAASAVSRLHEHREAKLGYSLFCKTLDRLALTKEQVIRTFHKVYILKIALA